MKLILKDKEFESDTSMFETILDEIGWIKSNLTQTSPVLMAAMVTLKESEK